MSKKLKFFIVCLVAYLGAFFNAQAQVPIANIISGQKYNLKHVSTGLYLQFLDNDNGDFCINALPVGSNANFDFIFTAVPGVANTFMLGINSGNNVGYMSGNGWNMQLGNPTTASQKQIILLDQTNNVVRLRAGWDTGNTVNFDGTPVANSRIYANKGGNANANFIIELSPNAVDMFLVLNELIATATNTVLPSIPATASGVTAYLTAAIATAQAVVDSEISENAPDALLALQAAIDLVNTFKTAVADANTILASAGTIPVSQGWTAEADAALTAAIATANAVANDAALIAAAVTQLNAAVVTYKAAELVPRFNADPTKKYRILIADNNGNYVRYMAKKSSASNNVVPAAIDLGIDPDMQLFYFEPQAGQIDVYKIKNIKTDRYLAANGEGINETSGGVWTVVYNKNLNTAATTAAEASGAWFRLNSNGNANNYWSQDNGTWPDAVSNMWTGKGVSGDRGSLFRIEENPDPNIAFQAFKVVFLAYIAEIQTLYNTTVQGTLPGQYTAKPALADALLAAN
ncbi:MAG: hypothetical protein LBV31_01525, partial [Prevotellaceae bacterium]|nr:hypothetical protein [Prevotellaceae bacterium]